MKAPAGLAGGARAMLAFAFVSLALIWMPLALLRQIDAFVGFLTPLQLARDVALAYLLMAAPALILTLCGFALRMLLRRAGLAEARAALAGWCVVLVPTLWVCLWQLGGSLWMWLTRVGLALPSSANTRVLAALLLLAALAALLRWVGLRVLLDGVISKLAGLNGLAIGLLAPALVCLAVDPPRLLSHASTEGRPAAAPGAPDIYLISIDTLAEADAQTCGNGPTLMPRLHEFAARATCFSRYYSSANFTTPSTATLETGALPWHHWAVQIVAQLPRALQQDTLTASLAHVGYETHSINANLLAAPRHHGTERSWDSHAMARSESLGAWAREGLSVFSDSTLPYWFASLVPFLDTLDVYLHAERNPYAPEFTYEAALKLLAASSDRPRFMWLHTLPPHDPYLPPPETKYKLLPRGELERWSQFKGMGDYAQNEQSLIDKHRLRYRESILGADAALGRLLDELARSGRLDKAIVIVTSDHGESFEHGFLGHAGGALHNDLLQVPLLIKLPGQREARRITTPVSLVDLAPTIADLAGAAPPVQADGRSLRPALEGH
ncbi:MAG TPA: sulfatase, partial [Burkholderiaceae bacterium]